MLEKYAYMRHLFFLMQNAVSILFLHLSAKQVLCFYTIFVLVLKYVLTFLTPSLFFGRKTDSWWWSFVICWIYVKSQKGKIIKLLLQVTLCKYSQCKSLLGICNWLLPSSYSFQSSIPHVGASIILLYFKKENLLLVFSLRVMVQFLRTMGWYFLDW